jgi:hypothetical protein
VVSVTDTYGRILGFLDESRKFSIKQLLSCTYEAEWTPFQTHYFFSGSAGNRTRASESVAQTVIVILMYHCHESIDLSYILVHHTISSKERMFNPIVK